MFSQVKNYIKDYTTLAKLRGIEAVSKIAASVLFVVILALFAFFFILLGNIALGFGLGIAFDNYALGFLAVTGIYLLLIILLVVFRKKLANAVVNMVIAASTKNKFD